MIYCRINHKIFAVLNRFKRRSVSGISSANSYLTKTKVSSRKFSEDDNKNANGSSYEGCSQRYKEVIYVNKFRKIQQQIDVELNERILRDIETKFDLICEKVENFSSVDPLYLIYLPNVCLSRQKVDFFISKLVQNWLEMLKPRLNEFSSSLVSDLNFPLLNMENNFSKGNFLKHFGWYNYKTIADITINDVELMPAK